MSRGFKIKSRERIIVEAWGRSLRWHVRLVGGENDSMLGKFRDKADALDLARREASTRKIGIYEN